MKVRYLLTKLTDWQMFYWTELAGLNSDIYIYTEKIFHLKHYFSTIFLYDYGIILELLIQKSHTHTRE